MMRFTMIIRCTGLTIRWIIFGFLFMVASSAAFAFDPTHLAHLERTGNCENCDLSGADLRGKKLRDRDLSGANLTKANLSGLDLTLTYFTNANLRGANLSGSILRKAIFAGADLTEADLTKSTIPLTDFTAANLTNAKLNDAVYTYNDFSYAIITGLDVADGSGGMVCGNCGPREGNHKKCLAKNLRGEVSVRPFANEQSCKRWTRGASVWKIK